MKIHTALALLALAALALNGVGIPRRMPGVWAKVREAAREARTWDESGFRISSDYLNDVRALVRRGVPPGAELGMVTEKEGVLSSTERSAHIAVAFERLPGRVDLAGAFGMLAYDALLLPWGSERAHGADLRAAGFEKRGETLAWELWARAAEPPAPGAASRRSASPAAQAVGLALVAAVALCGAWAGGWTGALFAVAGWALALGAALAAGWTGPAAAAATAVAVAAAAAAMHNAQCRMHNARTPRANETPRTPREESLRSLRSLREEETPRTPRESVVAAALAAAWTILALGVTLCHTLSPPNGLGVSGGRAALWLLSGGVPEGFFSDPALATMQPAYPPGLALLTLGAWSAAGGVGEWLVQLLALAPFAALLWLLLARAPGFAAKLWVFALFCTGTALNMASLYYSEGWMLLFLAVGAERLPRDGRKSQVAGRKPEVWIAWGLIGLAGFFKNEGILFAGLLWAVVRCFRGGRAAPLPALLAGLAPALAWIAFSRWSGGALADYAPLWAPDGGRFLFALGRVLRDAFLAPWGTVFAWPLAALGLLASAATVLSRFARAAARAKPEGRPVGESARSESALCRETPRTPRTPRENQTLRSLRSLRENQTLRSLRENPTPRPLREAAAFLLLCVPAIAFVYSLSRAPDLDWHVWSSLPRLLWDAAALAAALITIRRGHGEGAP